MKKQHLDFIANAIKLLNEHSQEAFVSKADAKKSADNLQEIITYQLMTMESPVKRIVNKILDEVERAENKHPDWPTDMVYAAAIVSEESGELMRACVQHEMESEFGCITEVETEAIQTAATCVRLLSNTGNL